MYFFVNADGSYVHSVYACKSFAEETPIPVDGTTADMPQMGETYYFDFQDKTSDIWDKGESAEAAQGTALKTGTMGMMTVDRAGKFHSTDHGMNGQAQFTFLKFRVTVRL